MSDDTRLTIAELRSGKRLDPRPSPAFSWVMAAPFRTVKWTLLAPALMLLAPFFGVYFGLELAGKCLRPVANGWRSFAIEAATQAQIALLLVTGKARRA